MMIKFYVWAVVLCFYSESAQVNLQGMRDQIIPFSQEEAIRECIQLEDKLFKFNEIILANHSNEANYKTYYSRWSKEENLFFNHFAKMFNILPYSPVKPRGYHGAAQSVLLKS